MKADEIKRVKKLEAERIVADQVLEVAALRDVAKGRLRQSSPRRDSPGLGCSPALLAVASRPVRSQAACAAQAGAPIAALGVAVAAELRERAAIARHARRSDLYLLRN